MKNLLFIFLIFMQFFSLNVTAMMQSQNQQHQAAQQHQGIPIKTVQHNRPALIGAVLTNKLNEYFFNTPSNQVNFNVTDQMGKTALWFAANAGNKHAVKLLLEKGGETINLEAAPVSGSNKQRTPLWIAAYHGHEECLELLIKAGANIESSCNEITPLLAAIINKQTACAEILIHKSANINTIDPQGTITPILFAVSQGNDTLLQLLIDKYATLTFAPQSGNFKGKTALHVALERGHDTCIEMLLNKPNSGYDKPDSNGATPLFKALQKRRLDWVNNLLEKKVDLNAAPFRGIFKNITPLMLAIAQKFDQAAQALIQAHADIHRKDEDGKTALWIAVNIKNLEIVQKLITEGADVNVQVTLLTGDRTTPLITAVYNGDADCVKALTHAHADTGCTNNQGQTALDIAREKNLNEIISILEQAQAAETLIVSLQNPDADNKSNQELMIIEDNNESNGLPEHKDSDVEEIKETASDKGQETDGELELGSLSLMLMQKNEALKIKEKELAEKESALIKRDRNLFESSEDYSSEDHSDEFSPDEKPEPKITGSKINTLKKMPHQKRLKK